MLLCMGADLIIIQIQSSATHLQGIFTRLLPTYSKAIIEGRSDEHNRENVSMHIDHTFYLKQLIFMLKSV